MRIFELEAQQHDLMLEQSFVEVERFSAGRFIFHTVDRRDYSASVQLDMF